MILLWWGVFVAEGLLMFVDEYLFHRKRIIPLWEVWGHPVDALTVALAFLWLYVAPLDYKLPVYVVLSVSSCLCVTKDEWVHKKYCEGFENWLHAVLFLLHPVMFVAGWELQHITYFVMVPVFAIATGLFQLIYWKSRYERHNQQFILR